jgi:hypothetical protein
MLEKFDARVLNLHVYLLAAESGSLLRLAIWVQAGHLKYFVVMGRLRALVVPSSDFKHLDLKLVLGRARHNHLRNYILVN